MRSRLGDAKSRRASTDQANDGHMLEAAKIDMVEVSSQTRARPEFSDVFGKSKQNVDV